MTGMPVPGDAVSEDTLPEDGVPEEGAPGAVDDGRPHVPAVAGLVAVAAALAGAAAVVLYGWLPEGWRLLIALAMIVAGVVVARPSGDPDVRRTWVLGRWVLAGIGSAGVVIGAYFAGVALVAMSVPDGPFFGRQQPDLPPPVVILLLLYGIPLIALIALAVRGQAAGLAGTGVVVPVLTVSILAAAGASASVVAFVALAVALVCVPVAVLSTSRWAGLAIITGTTAASFAVGAGVSPFGTLTRNTSRPTDEATETAAGTVPAGLVPVVLIVALAAAAVLLILAVTRRDTAGALVGAALFAVPPAYLLIATSPFGENSLTVEPIALAAVPVVVLLIALTGARLPALREGLGRLLRLPGAHPAGFLAAAGVAAVVLVVQGLPTFGLPEQVVGVITLVVLAAAAVLAMRLTGTAGAVLAGVTLVGLHLGVPWLQVINGEPDRFDGIPDWRVAAAIGLLVAIAAAVVLIARHPRAGVWAAGAYLLAGAMATLLWTLVAAQSRLFAPGESGYEVLVVLVVPLLVLGVPAAVLALRGSAAGQAAGAVLVAVGAFIPLHAVIDDMSSDDAPNAEVVMQLSLAPFTPTNVQSTARLLDAGTPTLLGVLAMLLLSLVLLASTARRPSGPLTAAVTLAVVIGVQVATISALEEWGLDGTDTAVWIFTGFASVLGAAAVIATTAAGNRRYAPVTPQARPSA